MRTQSSRAQDASDRVLAEARQWRTVRSIEATVVHIPDAQADPEFATLRAGATASGRMLGVPMLREGAPLGVFRLQRHKVRPFTDKQIELVEIFADQAVIAIENTRLFEEVQARNRDLTALGEVGRAVGSTLDLKGCTEDNRRARRPSLRYRCRFDVLLSRGGR